MSVPTSAPLSPPVEKPVVWFKTLNRYQWFVLFVAALGWLFDCLDQQLFVLARPAAMESLIPDQATVELTNLARRQAGDYATTFFIFGWAMGGLFFGMLGDRLGRAKTMLITILLYSAFTGLSAFAWDLTSFSAFRFLTGLGVGGEFAVGVALVAEVMPANARPYTLGLLQALSALGNISAAFIFLGLGIAEEEGMAYSPWRVMFLIGAVPALLVVLIRAKLKEPEQWQKVALDGAVNKQLGSYRELFRDPRWRKHAILGLILGCSGIIGLWSVGFFTPDLIRFVQRPAVAAKVYGDHEAAARAPGNAAEAEQWAAIRTAEVKRTQLTGPLKELQSTVDPVIKGRLSRWSSYSSLMINIGAFFGMFGFGALAQKIGRKPTFALGFVAAFISTVAVFWFLTDFWQIFVMVPIMGFCQLSLFAGYAIYFPELFPTRLRSTGTSFCYNVGRFIAALGPLVKAYLESVFSNTPEPLRYAGVTMCLVFLVGLLVLPFLPETRGKPLPE
jgi:MFS family permease